MQGKYEPFFGKLIGGCGRFDIRIDADGDVGLIWGNSSLQWGLLDGRGGIKPRPIFLPIRLVYTEGKEELPTEQELKEVTQFLQIFAPYVVYEQKG